MSYAEIITILKGGPTSGNFGHAGVPGKRGGSAPGGGHGRIGVHGGMSSDAKRKLVEELRAARGKKPESDGFPSDLTTLKYVRGLGGSTGADLVEGPDGKRYVRKQGASAEHLQEEAYADNVYRAAGIDVPKFRLYDTPDGPVKLSEFVEGKSMHDVLQMGGKQAEDARLAAQKGFAADVLLSNRDSVGMVYDNMLVDKSGKVWRIDNGGSLRYRAQGAKKSDWGDNPKDFYTLRDKNINQQTARVFGDIKPEAIKTQVQELSKRKKAIMAALPKELQSTVSKRLEHLQDMTNE